MYPLTNVTTTILRTNSTPTIRAHVRSLSIYFSLRSGGPRNKQRKSIETLALRLFYHRKLSSVQLLLPSLYSFFISFTHSLTHTLTLVHTRNLYLFFYFSRTSLLHVSQLSTTQHTTPLLANQRVFAVVNVYRIVKVVVYKIKSVSEMDIRVGATPGSLSRKDETAMSFRGYKNQRRDPFKTENRHYDFCMYLHHVLFSTLNVLRTHEMLLNFKI